MLLIADLDVHQVAEVTVREDAVTLVEDAQGVLVVADPVVLVDVLDAQDVVLAQVLAEEAVLVDVLDAVDAETHVTILVDLDVLIVQDVLVVVEMIVAVDVQDAVHADLLVKVDAILPVMVHAVEDVQEHVVQDVVEAVMVVQDALQDAQLVLVNALDAPETRDM